MNTTKKIAVRRDAFTLVEMLVVIAIILAVAALAAAFAPRVNDNQKLSRAVDNLEQWLLTAKLRAKRDGLATGLRFIQAPGDANIDPSLKAGGPPTVFSQFQYIQQPEPLTGGIYLGASPAPPNPPPIIPSGYPPPYQYLPNSNFWYAGGLITSATAGTVNFVGVDFSLGGAALSQQLVQSGDALEINGGGVFLITGIAPTVPSLSLTLAGAYGNSLIIGGLPSPTNPTPSSPTTNYRILRQPRILIGEEPLALPDNYSASFYSPITGGLPIPGYLPPTSGCNVAPTPLPINGLLNYEILFSPSGAVIGSNAGTPILWISVWDTTMDTPDPNRVGIVGVQGRSGFIGAYGVSLAVPPGIQPTPFYFVQTARESGL